MQEHPDPTRRRKPLSTTKELVLEGNPFPRVHTKAAETKYLVEPVTPVLRQLASTCKPGDREVVELMLRVPESSRQIDILVDEMVGYKVTSEQGARLEARVQHLNAGTAKLCATFQKRGQFLFNLVPKNHYLFHLAQLGRHMSPQLAWCYQGEDLMQKVKRLAEGTFRGTPPRRLGIKILGKYLVGLSHALSHCELHCPHAEFAKTRCHSICACLPLSTKPHDTQCAKGRI